MNITCPSTFINWKGYTWCIRNALNSGPGMHCKETMYLTLFSVSSFSGPNDFLPSNVWVDSHGLLHLQITNASGLWTCAELYTNNRFQYGTFQWQIDGRLDIFDQKIVLGLFTYGPPVAGADGTNEIDIEFARWDQNGSAVPNIFNTIWPATLNNSHHGTSLFYNQTNLKTTHRFTWSSTSISMKSLYGFQDDDTNLFHSWQSSPNYTSAIPQASAPIHMNLWVFHFGTLDRSPRNGQPVEVVIHDFKYIDKNAVLTTSVGSFATSLKFIDLIAFIFAVVSYTFH